MRRALAAAALAVLVGCGGADDDDDSGDAPAELACMHFRNVAGDASSGLLTDAEVRSKLQEVHDDARLADTPEIRRKSEEMLAAFTQGSEGQAAEAVREFGEACDDLGY